VFILTVLADIYIVYLHCWQCRGERPAALTWTFHILHIILQYFCYAHIFFFSKLSSATFVVWRLWHC